MSVPSPDDINVYNEDDEVNESLGLDPDLPEGFDPDELDADDEKEVGE